MTLQKNRNHIKRIAKSIGRVATGLLAAFVIAFAGLPGIFVYNNGLFGLKDNGVSVAQAKTVTNGYILEIATGLNDGSDIEFIEFSYEAEDGNTYKRFLFPGEDSLANGYKLAAQVASDVSIAREVSSDYAYGMQHEWDEVGPGTGLKQNAVDQYYFITESPIKKITKFDAFLGKKGKWTCLRMQLYKVDDLAGLRMAGTYSNTWYIDYTGTLIAELTNPISSTWSDDNANYLHMTQKADLKTDFSDVSYATHELQSDYGIRIDFADVYGAGLEYLTYPYGESVHALKSFDYAEGFALTLTYKDTYGIDRFLNLPVITNTVLYLAKSRVKDSKVVGIAQQGDTIYFEGSIPDLVKLESVSITLGTNKTYDLLGIKTVKNKSAITSREGLSNKDDISINCMAIYDKKTTTVTPYTEGALLKYVFEGDPVYSHVATISSGEGFYSNETNSLSLGTYNKKGLVPVDNNDYYLVEFKTDDIASAGTNGDLYMQLTYANVSGYEAKTAEISLRDATRDLYGYWPALMEDYAYQRGTTPGNIMQAILQLNDVDRFTGLTIRMGDTNADDYQFKDIKIYALGNRGKREVVFKDQSVSRNKTSIEVTRNFSATAFATITSAAAIAAESAIPVTTENTSGSAASVDPNKLAILDISDTVLIQQGDILPVDFVSAKIGTIVDTSWDFGSYAVSYADATQNFRFTKARKSYNIAVKVFDDTVTTDANGNASVFGGNGDSGSENLFYFQLIFQNGTSGYVLANRQIKGDCFMSGDTANFEISTNADYGNIMGIRIIPDDSSENNKKYDKLNIDSIRISELGVQGTHTVWVVDNVGWIDIGYTEEMEMNGMGGRPGRTESEIAKTMNVDYTTNAIQLEVAIRTISGTQMEGAASQFRGTLSVDINYIKSNGEHEHTGAKDAVALMYDYMRKKGGGDSGGSVSQISTMFRENHTDRFFIEIEDAKKLVSMDFSMVQKDDPYTWNIGGVSVRLITDVGILKLNNFDEYEYQREEEPEVLCIQRSETVPAYHPWLTKDGQQKLNIPLTDNTIEVYDNQQTKISAIAREPASKDDVLNVFVFPNVAESNALTEFDLDVLLHFAHVYGNIYQTGGTLNRYIPREGSTDRPVFYLSGIKASGMVDLNSIEVTADSAGALINMAILDYAVVQQVRSGVVVASYYIDLKGGNAFTTVREYPSSNTAGLGYQDTQVLAFELGEGTLEKNLFAEKIDLALQLKYKVANDPSGIEYLSPYTYFTDQDIVKIRAGQLIDMKFNNMFVGEITGINIGSVGDVSANIDKACIACYRTDSQNSSDIIAYYSFGNPVEVAANTVVPMTRTANTEDDKEAVKPVEITFSTSAASNVFESGTSDPVWMQLYTVDAEGAVDDTNIYPDIKKYLTDGSKSFVTDKVQTIRFLVKGASSLRRIILEPKSKNGLGNAGWSLDSVSVKLGDDDPITRSVNERIYEGSPKLITLSNITINAEVYYRYDAEKTTSEMERIKETGKKLVALPEVPFVIVPYVYGSELGHVVKVVEVTDDGYESGELTDLLKDQGAGRWAFTPPKSETTKNYKISVASSEVEAARIEIFVKVLGVEPPKQEETTEKTTEVTTGETTEETPKEDSGESAGDNAGENGNLSENKTSEEKSGEEETKNE